MTEPFKLSSAEARTLSRLLSRVGDAQAIQQFIDACEGELTHFAKQHAAGAFAPRRKLMSDIKRIQNEAHRLRAAVERASEAARWELDQSLWGLLAENGGSGDLLQLKLLVEALIRLPVEDIRTKPDINRIPIANIARAYGRAFNLRPTASKNGPFAKALGYLADIFKVQAGISFPASNSTIEAALEEFGRPELDSAPAGRPRKKRSAKTA